MTSLDDQLEPARVALDEGDPAAALELLRELPESTRREPAAAALMALALLDLEEPQDADRLLEAGASAPDDPDWLFARAELDLAHWRLDEARANYARLVEATGDSATVALRRGLIEDLEGRPQGADAELERARALDPELPIVGPVGDETFAELVEGALDALPPVMLERLDEVAVVVDPVPERSLAGSAPADTPPDALGLFVGTSDLDRHHELSGEPGPAIFLFQRNLERRCGSLEELSEEVRITLLHELGHLLGFDEDGVDALGLA